MTNLKLLIISTALFSYSLSVQASSNKHLSGIASYYGKQHHGKLMANGKPFNMYKVSFAHKKYPLGTTLEVCYKTCVTAKVTDRGPYISGRVLDVSQAAAIKIGLFITGVGSVKYSVISAHIKRKHIHRT